MTSCVQRANENLQQRRMSRDLHLTNKGTDAMKKKKSTMKRKRDHSGMETTDRYDVCRNIQTRAILRLCGTCAGWKITLAPFAATQFCYLLAALGRQCSLMNEQLSRMIIKN